MPEDPIMLFSFLNMKLRDMYSSLDALADDMDISAQELENIIKKLSDAGFTYDEKRNQFV
ncbi:MULTISPECIES: DUF4250 domain-containing protein [unclassified Butyrivibrio]|uniref:DUF4250 domain-containing protein n=1 Tax=unclassified Butyrivibrio TaxID=2639466 RepID=UPI0008E7A60E|nr:MULTISPECIES: DUF4250 domain-containing protein [unclassified Butyrivibrio]RKM60048.1 DUF4250 domain-containing protein [Butyrivibrio sp. XB500-5]SFU51810.1 protein of unknown function [Butyrivibrio sp. INlla21]